MRAFVVSNDRAVSEALIARTPHHNVRVVQELEGLKGLLTAIETEQDEALVGRLQEQAKSLFFTKDDRSSLYYREAIGEIIRKQYAAELLATP
jgi:hypothetical protein